MPVLLASIWKKSGRTQLSTRMGHQANMKPFGPVDHALAFQCNQLGKRGKMIARLVLIALLLGSWPATVHSEPKESFDDNSACFMSRKLFVCANNIKKGVYTVAVLNPTKSPYPTSLLINCNGKPEATAFGTMPPVMPSNFLDQFCAHVEKQPYLEKTPQYI